ncbi:serine protease filzig isoform X4 [Hyalella azteca]|uniref:Serine protease filzig isoform X4 n=1 Tax=Hyalella azteca TaxID=294128 RepID=A0A979FTI8_HYAAZ|nr:serine protease filzig isoform X4 [Hyalella azteca]
MRMLAQESCIENVTEEVTEKLIESSCNSFISLIDEVEAIPKLHGRGFKGSSDVKKSSNIKGSIKLKSMGEIRSEILNHDLRENKLTHLTGLSNDPRKTINRCGKEEKVFIRQTQSIETSANRYDVKTIQSIRKNREVNDDEPNVVTSATGTTPLVHSDCRISAIAQVIHHIKDKCGSKHLWDFLTFMYFFKFLNFLSSRTPLKTLPNSQPPSHAHKFSQLQTRDHNNNSKSSQNTETEIKSSPDEIHATLSSRRTSTKMKSGKATLGNIIKILLSTSMFFCSISSSSGQRAWPGIDPRSPLVGGDPSPPHPPAGYEDEFSSNGIGGAAPYLSADAYRGSGPLSREALSRSHTDDNEIYYNEPECGVQKLSSNTITKRIIGGDEAHFAELPWQAHIRIAGYQCGGVLVNRYYVATAAHCVHKARLRDITIHLGEFDTKDTGQHYEPYPKESFGVVEKRTHPNFKYMLTQPDRFDVAVLRLSRRATYQPNIVPICLPPPGDHFPGAIGIVAGWGKTDNSYGKTGTNILRKVMVPIIDNQECLRWHHLKNIDVKLHYEMFCAGHAQGKMDACLGDSGGPLVVNNKGRWTLAGITSAGFGCAVDHQPGIYHKVAITSGWIAATLLILAGLFPMSNTEIFRNFINLITGTN